MKLKTKWRLWGVWRSWSVNFRRVAQSRLVKPNLNVDFLHITKCPVKEQRVFRVRASRVKVRKARCPLRKATNESRRLARSRPVCNFLSAVSTDFWRYVSSITVVHRKTRGLTSVEYARVPIWPFKFKFKIPTSENSRCDIVTFFVINLGSQSFLWYIFTY